MKPTKIKIIAPLLFAWCLFNNFQCYKTEEVCSPECGQNSVCFESKCMCISGYEGAKCDTLCINKYVGHFVGVSIKNTQPPTTIDAQLVVSSIDPRRGTLIPLNDQKYIIEARINSKFNIFPQDNTIDSLHHIGGPGIISKNADTIRYTLYLTEINTNQRDSVKVKLVRVP
jgi:hypothetical protein